MGKYMTFTFARKLVLIDSMELMKSSLEKFNSKLIKNKFKCLSEEFSKKQLELVKQKFKLLTMIYLAKQEKIEDLMST